MKIGLAGNLCNGMYCMARALFDNKIDVTFIRDRSPVNGAFAFSQPIWEDVALTLSYDHLMRRVWFASDWNLLEQQAGWSPPKWLYDPLNDVGTVTPPLHPRVGRAGPVIVQQMQTHAHWIPALSKMLECDALIVTGTDALLMAWASGKPYIFWPHGMDIRQAIGMWPVGHQNPQAPNPVLLAATNAALCVSSHDPTAGGCQMGDAMAYLPGMKLEHLPIPAWPRERKEKSARREELKNVLTEIGAPVPLKSEYLVFVPSRVDFMWKGQDRIVAALEGMDKKDRDKYGFIFSGWGVDYPKLKEMMPDATFLPCALSKPYLYRVFGGADLVIDEFVSGVYGTSALEAWSCGTPVMTHLDRVAFARCDWPAPATIGVGNLFPSGHLIEERAAAIALRKWMKDRHSPEYVAKRVKEIFKANGKSSAA